MNDQLFADILARQFKAGLAMMRNAIEKCPDELWKRRPGDEASFWQHALHVLYYTRLFMADSITHPDVGCAGRRAMELVGLPMKDMSPAEIDRMARTIGFTGLTEASFTTRRIPSRAELLDYQQLAESLCEEMIPQLATPGTADAPNPMPWMHGTRAELMLYNLRHLMLHLGRLHSMLGRQHVRVHWIGGGS